MSADAARAPATPWTASVLTLFPGMFPGPLGDSLAGRGLAAGLWGLETVDIRAFAADRHATVDDVPFGGGPGMVMRADVVDAALAAATAGPRDVDRQRPIVYLTPRGWPLDQARVRGLAAASGVVLLCGRYEGIDQRVLDAWSVEEISLGDYVLSGGEIAALALIDAVVRLLPGVIGREESLVEESFEQGLLEYPHFTRPAVWNDRAGGERRVPEVLLSGHHARIADWRRAEAERATRERRPDLWTRRTGAGGPGDAAARK
ncbi:MAG: tRNA (guanosine(37)-N1)-methyltransferase TrmD [Alphaproteobacteria bacterium]